MLNSCFEIWNNLSALWFPFGCEVDHVLLFDELGFFVIDVEQKLYLVRSKITRQSNCTYLRIYQSLFSLRVQINCFDKIFVVVIVILEILISTFVSIHAGQCWPFRQAKIIKLATIQALVWVFMNESKFLPLQELLFAWVIWKQWQISIISYDEVSILAACWIYDERFQLC